MPPRLFSGYLRAARKHERAGCQASLSSHVISYYTRTLKVRQATRPGACEGHLQGGAAGHRRGETHGYLPVPPEAGQKRV